MNRRSFHQSIARAALFGALLALPALSGAFRTQAQDAGRDDGMVFLPDVVGQFRLIARAAQPLGYHITTTPNPSLCRHYQGLQRVNGPDGTPYFLVTRSGNLPGQFGASIVCDDSPSERYNGNLVIFRMDSRDKNGERMRSNRLRKGLHVDYTEPPAEDTAAIYYTVVGGDDPNDPDPCMRPGLLFREGRVDADGDGNNDCSSPPPHVYQHPGGMQRIGHILALAMDTPRNLLAECYAPCVNLDPPQDQACRTACDANVHYPMASSNSRIMFFDVTDPVHPVFKSQYIPRGFGNAVLHDSDGLAITPIPGERYLMAVSGGFEGDEPISFFRSSGSDLGATDLTWEYVDRDFDINDEDEDAHQSLHFLREGSLEGPLYLAASRGHPLFGPDHDKLDLMQVTSDTETFEPNTAVHVSVRYRGQAMSTYPTTGGFDRIANLAAATGFYESPSGELIFYASEHDNDGPNETVKLGEWVHQDVIRPGSPTLLPSIALDGPFAVDEGSSVALTGSAAPPVTKPFIELYTGTDFTGWYPLVDFDDVAKDDYDNFHALEPYSILNYTFNFDHQAQSWKWYAPVGCSIQTVDHHSGNVATLPGTGAVVPEADLVNASNDAGTGNMNQKIDEVRFLDNCTSYYATPVSLRWDLDRNGSYETSGTSIPFSAAALDGPSTVMVPVQAQHPAGGAAAQSIATVNVLNVPPALSEVVLTDGGGNEVGAAIPYVLVGMPITAHATFTDPGRLDHQTAALNWGDGTTDAQSAFALFDQAFGDGTGEVRQAHRYLLSGTFPIGLTVTDDDGDAGAASASVRVVTPEQAVIDILASLDELIENTTDRRTLAALLKARKSLAGSPPDGSHNGALYKIRNGNRSSAIASLRDAINWLNAAQGRGTFASGLITQIQQVIAALSTRPGTTTIQANPTFTVDRF